jgi:hypothetical protein
MQTLTSPEWQCTFFKPQSVVSVGEILDEQVGNLVSFPNNPTPGDQLFDNSKLKYQLHLQIGFTDQVRMFLILEHYLDHQPYSPNLIVVEALFPPRCSVVSFHSLILPQIDHNASLLPNTTLNAEKPPLRCLIIGA